MATFTKYTNFNMSSLNDYKQELIKKIQYNACCRDIVDELYGSCNLKYEADYYNFMDKMSFDQIVDFVNGALKNNLLESTSQNIPQGCSYNASTIHGFVDDMNKKIREIKHAINSEKLVEDVAAIKEHIQNTADIVNLFTDIDKNRTNLEEQNKQINNRLDKLESTINQLVNMLQKS